MAGWAFNSSCGRLTFYSVRRQILQAENLELRKQLNCGACKTRRKDTVILKCMHVFCGDCVRAVIDNRSRKCPQCGGAFSATEFKRIYLA